MAGSKYFSILFKDIEKNSQKILIKYCGLSKQYDLYPEEVQTIIDTIR